tara:strand:+ start:414 stop:743 length:330 start_codon:yes stop_codon:yes gene_type:complete
MGAKLQATPSAEMGPVYEEWWGEKIQAWMKQFEARLTKGKFICGDKLTVYDIEIGGYFTDRILNVNSKGAAYGPAALAAAPERVQQYVRDFQAEFADHLAARPESKMGL